MLDALGLIFTGFSVVMMVLAALWGACHGIGMIFIRAEEKAKAPAPAAPAPAAPAPASGVPPHHLVAIAAAVATSLGGGYVITSVAAPAHEVTAWPVEGRNSIFASHVTRPGWAPHIPTTVAAGRAQNTKRG